MLTMIKMAGKNAETTNAGHPLSLSSWDTFSPPAIFHEMFSLMRLHLSQSHVDLSQTSQSSQLQELSDLDSTRALTLPPSPA